MQAIISISGAQGVGKTSIITELFKQGCNVITPSASNLAAHATFKSPIEKQGYIVKVMQDHLEAAKTASAPVYLDRSALDAYSYLMLDSELTAADKEPFYEVLQGMAAVIDFAFIPAPGEFKLYSNGIRSTDAAFQTQWHKELVDFASEMRIPYELVSGSISERVLAIRKTVHRLFE